MPRLLLLLLACAPLTGCYVLHTAKGQFDVMRRREPITEVIADPHTEPKLRTRLERVLAIREFAVKELALPDNGSYRTYADIQRPYVVWNVFATPEFEVEPRKWCFPIAGCVAYRGYFSREKAESFAQGLAARGDDVFVGGVSAYSTLGHFDDPVLNTMIVWEDVQLASIIFHELSHQLLYVAGDSSFNEAFATVVEAEGVRRWLHEQGRDAEQANYEARRRRYIEFAMLLIGARERLRELFQRDLPDDLMRAEKDLEYANLAAEYDRLRAHWGGKGAFDLWRQQGFNNAHLVSVATYQECVPGLERLLAESQSDLRVFYERVRPLMRLDVRARHEKVCTGPGTDEGAEEAAAEDAEEESSIETAARP